ncbi:MAG TPA: hypothetical protein VFU45_06070 [Gemmatimonadales bacterium]|nr:hypothetical protein [Gemmatimonadales bacterium]
MLAPLLLAFAALQAPAPGTVTVTVDSAHHDVVVTAGPYDLPQAMAGMSHAEMEHMTESQTELKRFAWPVDGWFRGFALEVRDGNGKALSRRILHHMIMINFDRRQLYYPAYERLMGAGQETADVTIPATIGVPMRSGMHLGMYLMWHNETGADIHGAYLVLRLHYAPKNQLPRPVDAMPIYMDVNLTVGGDNVFDLPPGITKKSHDFVQPIDGHLIAAGGHLHDFGMFVRLADVASGKTLVQLNAERQPNGDVTGLPRKLFGVSGAGLRLKAGRTYRVTGEYDNLTHDLIKDGAMAHIVGLFTPDDMRQWPKLDVNDPGTRADLADLESLGKASGGMRMGTMNHMKD